MRVLLTHGDITVQPVDAVVNAANHSLLGGGGVDGAIHRAGGPDILAECRRLRADRFPDGLPTGQSVATTAGLLAAQWVIHTVGPVYARSMDRSHMLRSCYRTSLDVAREIGASTLAFPLISSGVYGWPRDDAIRQALAVLTAEQGPGDATLVLFDRPTYERALEIRAEFDSAVS